MVKKTKIAAVDANTGMLTAFNKSGSVQVTDEFVNTNGGIKSTKVSMTVKIKLPKQSASKATMKAGKTKVLKLSNLSGHKVTWSIDNDSVASISSINGTDNGKGTNSVVITGKAPGPAKVTAVVDGDTEHPYEFNIVVK